MTTWEQAQADIPRHDRAATLTGRERDVATLAAKGVTNTRIAKLLNLTVSTVEQRLTSVYKKLGCHRPGLASALGIPQETPR